MEDEALIEGAVREFLEAHRVGCLGTADASRRPHVVPICYAVTNNRIYSVI
ncbi:MAG: pyridoxamine 5'-phosphate oxidase family protein, partial [Dehalococcoidia bacterium]